MQLVVLGGITDGSIDPSHARNGDMIWRCADRALLTTDEPTRACRVEVAPRRASRAVRSGPRLACGLRRAVQSCWVEHLALRDALV